MYHEQLVTFAAYNRWANQRLFEAAAALGPERFAADRGVFFHSTLGTLNHLLATDRIWMQRFTSAGEAPSRLDAVLFETFEPLREARAAEDARIEAYIGSLTEAALAGTFRYTPISKPVPVEGRLGPALFHLFNHQTHHRGQAHAILTGFGLPAPGLDLIAFIRETGRD
ncbi:DinB family protein [Aureimonas sp. AU40]|uniref:DinB family protein n=1 Tax=Aureimonas sp. AU40 TaxID=1637747 RepID=UPI0007814480|nr:DinB family protein [Aureimonas sp. AU40]